MSGFKPLAQPSDVIYLYDGSLRGFFCCVHESVYSHEIPVDIIQTIDAPYTLLETRYIETDPDKAEKVQRSIPEKISGQAFGLVYKVFLSCLEQKELKLLVFLLRAYREGGRLTNKLGDPDVAPLLAAERHLLGEVHLLKGFIRFSDVGGALVSTITPKNFVLPFLKNHFSLRCGNEDFMIFDKTHKAALMHYKGKNKIVQVDDIDFPPASEEELCYQALWKQFYNTVAIKGRENPRCRMTHMPKRYWENMLEVQELL